MKNVLRVEAALKRYFWKKCSENTHQAYWKAPMPESERVSITSLGVVLRQHSLL